MKNEIETKVMKIVAKQLGADFSSLKLKTNFEKDLGTDSLDAVELLMELEDSFKITIPDEKVKDFQTISDIVNYIKRVQGAEITIVIEKNKNKILESAFNKYFDNKCPPLTDEEVKEGVKSLEKLISHPIFSQSAYRLFKTELYAIYDKMSEWNLARKIS